MLYHNRDSDFFRIILRNLILFLSGALLGSILLRYWNLSAALSPSFFQESFSSGWRQTFWNCLHLPLILFFLGYIPVGPVLIPLAFGLEGCLLGMTIGLVSTSMGIHGGIALILSLVFRLLLLFPFSFLLGSWAVRHGLRFGCSTPGNGPKLLIMLIFVAAASAGFELLFGRQLGSLYYLTFGA